MAAAMQDVRLDESSVPPKVTRSETLEWQSFPSTSVASAPSAATVIPVGAAAPAQPANQSAAVAIELTVPEDLASPLSCLAPSFYSKLFNVSTAEVVARLKAAAWPLQQSTFLQTIGSKPDFYGPVWVCATLVFVIGASSNLNSWLSFHPEAVRSIWKYDFRVVTFALMATYGFAFGGAAALWVLLNWLGVVGMPLIYLICIYGYSLLPFIPAAFICILPSSGLQWTAAVFGGALSALFVFKSVYPVLVASGIPMAPRVAVPALVAAQVAFAVLLKVYFF